MDMDIININYQNMITQVDYQYYFYKLCKFKKVYHIKDIHYLLVCHNSNQILSNHQHILEFHTIL